MQLVLHQCRYYLPIYIVRICISRVYSDSSANVQFCHQKIRKNYKMVKISDITEFQKYRSV